MTSVEYKAKVDEFTELKANLDSIMAKIDSSSSSVTKCRKYLDNIIICGEKIDKDLLNNKVEKTIDEIAQTVEQLIKECTKKIDDYTNAYERALKKEKFVEKIKGGWFPWI